MKKQWITLFAVFALLMMLTTTAFAAHPPRLVDDADLLTDVEEEVLTAKLDAVSEEHQMDIVIVTVESTNGASPMAFADDYYDYNGYGYGNTYDGALLLISMEERDWWISTCGEMINVLDDYTIESIGDWMLDDLASGDYAAAFETFVNECDYYIDPPFEFMTNLLISLAIGFVVALIVTGVMRSKLKSVRRQAAASEYVKSGSMQVTQANEFFLYRNVSRVRRSNDSNGSSTHRSSSGRSHGGGGGKF